MSAQTGCLGAALLGKEVQYLWLAQDLRSARRLRKSIQEIAVLITLAQPLGVIQGTLLPEPPTESCRVDASLPAFADRKRTILSVRGRRVGRSVRDQTA